MSTFEKKVLMPKQIDHWVYRLTDKRDETVYVCPYSGTKFKRRNSYYSHFRRNMIRFKYENMFFKIREGLRVNSYDGIVQHRTIWIIVQNMSVHPSKEVVRMLKDDFPKTYTEFKKVIDNVLDEFYLKSM